MRLFATDQFCKPLAVSSCLDGLAFSRDRRSAIQVLFAVGELPPELTPRDPRRVDFALDSLAAVQGFVLVDMCGEVELMSLTNDELTALVCSPSRLRTLTDAELMNALRSGCNDALAVLFERHSDWVVETAREKLRNDAEVEATVGRVFADIFRAKDDFNSERENFTHWLLKYVESDRGRSFA